jgi:hypothetical protein
VAISENIMALSEAEIKLIEEGISLAISAVLATVKAAHNKEAIDWNSIRITETPETAFIKAQKANASLLQGTEQKPTE